MSTKYSVGDMVYVPHNCLPRKALILKVVGDYYVFRGKGRDVSINSYFVSHDGHELWCKLEERHCRCHEYYVPCDFCKQSFASGFPVCVYCIDSAIKLKFWK